MRYRSKRHYIDFRVLKEDRPPIHGNITRHDSLSVPLLEVIFYRLLFIVTVVRVVSESSPSDRELWYRRRLRPND